MPFSRCDSSLTGSGSYQNSSENQHVSSGQSTKSEQAVCVKKAAEEGGRGIESMREVRVLASSTSYAACSCPVSSNVSVDAPDQLRGLLKCPFRLLGSCYGAYGASISVCHRASFRQTGRPRAGRREVVPAGNNWLAVATIVLGQDRMADCRRAASVRLVLAHEGAS